MPLNLIFITPGNYTIEDNGIPGDNTSVIKDGAGTVIFTFVHPADSLGFTVTSPGVHLTVNLTDSLGAANLTIGDLTDPAVTPDSIVVNGVRTTGTVTLVSNGTITEGGNDGGADIVAGQLVLSAQTGVGTDANAIETQVGAMEVETVTGGITLSNFGSVQVGGISDLVDGLDVETSGNLRLTNIGTILLGDETGAETVHGGAASGNVTLIANGFDSDIIATSNQDAINAPGGNIVLQAGRDIGFGIIGIDFDNDVRARGSVTVNAGRDFLIDGFSDLASDDFGANTGGNAAITAGRNIHVRNIAGTDGSIAAGGSAGADVILTTGAGGAVVLDAPTSGAVSSFNGDVTINADRILIAASSGITAPGIVTLRPVTVGREMILGSASDAAFAVELSDAELDRIFSPNLAIGSNTAGNVSVISELTPAGVADLTIRGGEDILVQSGMQTANSISLIAGNNLIHLGGTIATGTLTGQVDALGGDEGEGGFGGWFSVSPTGTPSATSIVLNGNAEADTLRGAEGRDQTVHGNGGNDTIFSSGEGRYFGDTGNDTINAGLSSGLVDEFLDGGAGIDTLDTSSFGGDYHINLITGVTGFSYESFINFENVTTGDGADIVVGTGSSNIILTGAGDDTVAGGASADNLDGGADVDTLSYAGSSAAVLVRLFSNTVSGGHAAGDTIANFENVLGSSHGDDVIGSAGANVLEGANGNDTLNGGAGGDTLDGGAGTDLLSYTGSTSGVSVRLFSNTVFGGHAGGDTIVNFENVLGSSHGDDVIGSAGANVLEGSSGNDTLQGIAGNDTLNGGTGGDTLDGGTGTDLLSYAGSSAAVFVRLFSNTVFGGHAGGDTIANFENVFGSSHGDDLMGSSAANVLIGADGNDVLNGLLGADTMSGGAGTDIFRFNTALGAGNIDTINGYSIANDTIQIDNAVFTGLAAGTLAAGAFRIGSAAADAGDRIIYNSATGALLFDADGSGAGAAVQFATLSTGLAMSAAEFVVI